MYSGNPCDVQEIESLAQKHGFRVIYDAAHAFSVTYRERSVLSYGDISTLSLHATKLFHAVEGRALIIRNRDVYEKAKRVINFGYDDKDNIHEAGINAKMSEFHAAMGLAILDDMDKILEARARILSKCKALLGDVLEFQTLCADAAWNFAYMPVVFGSNSDLDACVSALNAKKIYPRRYFRQTLNSLAYTSSHSVMPVANDIAGRVACLPMYVGL